MSLIQISRSSVSVVNPVVGQLPEPVIEAIAAGIAICIEYR